MRAFYVPHVFAGRVLSECSESKHLTARASCRPPGDGLTFREVQLQSVFALEASCSPHTCSFSRASESGSNRTVSFRGCSSAWLQDGSRGKLRAAADSDALRTSSSESLAPLLAAGFSSSWASLAEAFGIRLRPLLSEPSSLFPSRIFSLAAAILIERASSSNLFASNCFCEVTSHQLRISSYDTILVCVPELTRH